MSQHMASYLVTPLPVHRDSREQGESFEAWCCEECERISASPIRSHAKTCPLCHWSKDLPPKVRLRADAYAAPGTCPDCGFKGLKYGTRVLCRVCKSEMQTIFVRECHCGELVPCREFEEHLEACQ